MREAVALGERFRASAPPNPWVGAVVVREGCVVGSGAHRAAGEDHAEVVALRDAGEKARGATVYVSLEPCAHHGKTPPCADALIAAGVSRVVVGVEDPDRRVAGRGLAHLKDAGIEVSVGVEREKVEASLMPYLVHRALGRPYGVAKVAVSLDGKVAARDGTSQWLSGEHARDDAHRHRMMSQAVVIGAGTALADRPRLTARCKGAVRQPLRVVCDSRGATAEPQVLRSPLFDTMVAPTLVATTDLATREAIDAWEAQGAQVCVFAANAQGRVPLGTLQETLAQRGVIQTLFEGGGTLLTALLDEGLVDSMVMYLTPCLLGEEGKPFFAGSGPATLVDAVRWQHSCVTTFGPDVCLEYRRAPCLQAS